MSRRALFAVLAATLVAGVLLLSRPAGAESVTLGGSLASRTSVEHSFQSGPGPVTVSLSCAPRARVLLEVKGTNRTVLASQSVNCRSTGSVQASAAEAGSYSVALTERAGYSTIYTLSITTPQILGTTTTTTSAPTTTTVPPPPPTGCSGVEVPAGASIQAAIDARPSGTVFCIRAGLYRLSSPLVPKTNMQLLGESGALVNGGGVVDVGIKGWGTGATGVVVRGLVVENFRVDGIQASSGWVVENSEVRYNGESGIKPGDITRYNYVHHNGRYGMSGGYGSVGSVVEGNEIAFNNTANYDWYDAGATKFVNTRNLLLRNNDVHDNYGPGLWTDGNNKDTTFEGNRIENNQGSGIIHEISYDAVVRNNVVTGNGFSDPNWGGGAGIQVASSPNVEIYGNRVELNKNGILLVQQGDRGAGSFGSYVLTNNFIHDNTIRMSSGFTGIYHYGMANPAPLYTTWNNRFSANSYWLTNLLARHWQWADAEKTRLDWQALGFDLAGTFGIL